MIHRLRPAAVATGVLAAALASCSLFTDLGGLDETEAAGGAGSDAGTTPGGDAATTTVETRDAAARADGDAAPLPGCVLSGTVEAMTASPGVVTEGAPGTTSWNNPTNARHADGLLAIAPMNGGNVTRRLLAKGFGLVVPAGAAVRGVTVKVRRRADSVDEVVDAAVGLVRAGVASATTRSAPGAWPLQLTTVTYGGAADTWGETWTPADVSSPEFGVAVGARGVDAAQAEAAVDHIEVTVHVERCKP